MLFLATSYDPFKELNFVFIFLANATYDGDKESEGEEDGVSSEDSRKVSLIILTLILDIRLIHVD